MRGSMRCRERVSRCRSSSRQAGGPIHYWSHTMPYSKREAETDLHAHSLRGNRRSGGRQNLVRNSVFHFARTATARCGSRSNCSPRATVQVPVLGGQDSFEAYWSQHSGQPPSRRVAKLCVASRPSDAWEAVSCHLLNVLHT